MHCWRRSAVMSGTKTNAILVQHESVTNELQGLLYDEQRNYLSVFRRFYLTLGELLFKKEKRMQEAQRQLRNAQLQVEIAKETLDANVKLYKDQTRALSQQYDNISSKVEFLAQKADSVKEDFEPTDHALRAQGLQFLHPAIELQELNVARRVKLNTVRRRFMEQDRDDVAEEDEAVANMTAAAMQAKKMGLSSLVGSLSSPRGSKGTPSVPIPSTM
eukprot:NODE_1660_length_1099_cov_67.210476_g1357_i0.p1 GENE.NODE_1660_length_1099_cov_67.210476_g1357_i0~~NODE_1660_length_1099_cov_67.210476_g1357_i0.p1  ORF type:complete len:217 (+),score=64.32 NODE_1660_length_1099_cov_67.210476_g1357_i0:304-954(+)